jgi:hypothetical protein
VRKSIWPRAVGGNDRWHDMHVPSIISEPQFEQCIDVSLSILRCAPDLPVGSAQTLSFYTKRVIFGL